MRRISNKAALSTLDIIKFPNNVLSPLSLPSLYIYLSLSVYAYIYVYILAALHKAQSQQERL